MFLGSIMEELSSRELSNNHIKVGIVGSGFIGRGLINQIEQMKGIKVSACAGRNAEKTAALLKKDNPHLDTKVCCDLKEVNETIGGNKIAVAVDPYILARSDIDILVECTGDVELGAQICISALAEKKDFIASPEMDVTLGPSMKKLADENRVIYSGYDGDEPGAAMELYRYVSVLGFEIIAAGKFKAFYNPNTTPTSSGKYADEFELNPYKSASFGDGCKMSIEMAILANATGLIPDTRGMHLPIGTLDSLTDILCLESDGGILRTKGVVEIVRGVEPSGGVFVVGFMEHPRIRKDLRCFKMGEGPNYLFYKPYHLCSIEMPISILKAVINREATIAPLGPPVAQVFATAKKDLIPGDKLDCIGGYTFNGLIDLDSKVREDNLLPVGIAAGVEITKPVKKGQPISVEDVEIDCDSLIWRLWR